MILHPDFTSKHFVCDLKLCRVLLEDNKNFLWVILVPLLEGKKNILDLSSTEYSLFCEEVFFVAKKLEKYPNNKPDQINIATLGNVTPQLHAHVILRYKDDLAWPLPAFGSKVDRYFTTERENIVLELKKQLTIF